MRRLPRTWEYSAASVLFLALMLVSISLLNAWYLFSKPLWLDEFHTVLLATRETLVESLRSLARGSDYNPPLLYVAIRGWGLLTGGVTEVTLRAFMFVCLWGSLVAVYALLRRQVRPIAAFAGGLVLWAHPLVLRAGFDGRFYAPWLLFTALFALSVADLHLPHQSIWQRLAMALTAAALCTIHYFGIITWGLIVLAAILRSGREWRVTLLRLVPAAAGPIALVACVPILVGQRAALTVSTWIAPVSLSQINVFVRSVFGWPALLVLFAFTASWFLLRRRHQEFSLVQVMRDNSLLFATALLPGVLLLVSLVLQPSLVDRYATPAALALTPLAAIAVESGGRKVGIFICALLVLVGARYVYYLDQAGRDFAAQIRSDATILLTKTSPEAPIIAVDRATLYPLHDYDSRLADRLIYPELDAATVRQHFPLGSETETRGNFILVERDVARIHSELYGLPRLIDLHALPRGEPVILVGTGGEGFVRRFLPGAMTRRLSARIWEVVPGGRLPAANADAQ